MYKRKKFHGGLKLLLLLLFIMLSGMCSTCFASEIFTPITNMTPFIWNQIIEKMDEAIPYYQNYNSSITNFETFKSNMDVDVVCSTFNNYMTGKQIDYFENCVFIIVRTNNNFQLRIAQNNNTHQESYPFIYLWQRSSTEIDVQYCNDSGTTVNGNPYYILNFNTNGTISLSDSTATYSRVAEVYAQPTTFNESIINCPYLIGFNNIQNCVCYYVPTYQGGSNFWGFFNNFVLLNEPDPEEPSGDISTGGTGTITNNSGDTTGKIDLSGIEQGIGNIQNQISGDTQKVIENQNQNTEQIVEAINNSNENYWGSDDELTGEQQEEEIENNLNNIIGNVSGELSQNEVIQQLERSRSRLFRFF